MADKGVIIFEHGSFAGNSQILRPGRYNVKDLSIGNDQLSSIKVPAGWKVTLFSDGNFAGRSVTLDRDTPSFKEANFNDQTSSLIVSKERPTVRRGERGDDVEDLQVALTKAGHPVDDDGIFGPKTEAAVKLFQKDRKLTADGIVGKNTWAAIDSLA